MLQRKAKVVVRIRPYRDETQSSPYSIPTPTTLTMDERKVIKGQDVKKEHAFRFDHVFNPVATQMEVYETVVKPIIREWTEKGSNGAVFAYGFTGTGKSYSLFGNDIEPGIMVHAAKDLLNVLRGTPWMLRVSMYEIAGDSCFDLLANKSQLKVRTDAYGNVHLRQPGRGSLSLHCISTMEEFLGLWQQAKAARSVGSSTVHDASSRSHGVVDIHVVSDALVEAERRIEEADDELIRLSNEKDDVLRKRIEDAYATMSKDAFMLDPSLLEASRQYGMPYESASAELERRRQEQEDLLTNGDPIHRGSLSFIDMAGCDWEKGTDVQTTIARREQAEINTSLLAVKECFRALSAARVTARIPFRNSPLTQVLKRHFQIGSNITMLATVGVPEQDQDRFIRQSLNTLRYAKLIGA
ncbi:hypothetical protein HK102_001037 [Quaeritorhiza haematococci]|nr:hypothetical protein HK102_001037 [Quaeritorhiza haematococci]